MQIYSITQLHYQITKSSKTKIFQTVEIFQFTQYKLFNQSLSFLQAFYNHTERAQYNLLVQEEMNTKIVPINDHLITKGHG